LVNTPYNDVLASTTILIMLKLKEKMIKSRDAITEIIINANRDRGKPKMTAFFLMFLYTLYFFIRPQ
jgi:hypothetical protein